MNKIHYQITVKGRVQGVGFRQSAKSEARFLGIHGIVNNLFNGDVYIEAEGSKDQLEQFANWCRKGSRYGYVDHVEIITGKLKNHSKFIIIY